MEFVLPSSPHDYHASPKTVIHRIFFYFRLFPFVDERASMAIGILGGKGIMQERKKESVEKLIKIIPCSRAAENGYKMVLAVQQVRSRAK